MPSHCKETQPWPAAQLAGVSSSAPKGTRSGTREVSLGKVKASEAERKRETHKSTTNTRIKKEQGKELREFRF